MAQFFQLDCDSIQHLSEELTPAAEAQEGVQYFVQTGSDAQQFVIINNPTPLITAAPFSTQLQPVYYLGSPTKTLANEMHNVPVVLNHLQQQQKLIMSGNASLQQQQQIVVSPPAMPMRSTPQTRVRGQTAAAGPSRPQELLNNRMRLDTKTTPAVRRQNGGGLTKQEDSKQAQMSDFQKFMEQKRCEKRAQRSPGENASGESLVEAKRPGRIIQPHPETRLPAVLRNFVPPPEIDELISRTTDNAEFENSVRMFVMLECGEQRLITFTTPKEDCTIHEILEQVGVPLEPDTHIAIAEVNIQGINLVVSVGFQPEPEEEKPSPAKEPQPPEAQKFVPGRTAVCMHCGYLSEDFLTCVRCRVKLPEDVRSVPMEARKKQPISINLKSSASSPHPASAVNKTTGSASTPQNTLLNKCVRKKVTPKKAIEEPVIVTLSSDDEDADEDRIQSKNGTSNGAADKAVISDKEPTIEQLKNVGVLSNRKTSAMACTTMLCRTIRIGSYRYNPTHDVAFNSKEMTLRAPHIQHPENSILITIPRKWIFKVLVHFQKVMPVIIYYLVPLGAEAICAQLGMSREDKDGVYFDPITSDETQRRLVLLPASLGEEDRWVLNTLYDEPCIIEELTLAEANAILMITSPKDAALTMTPTSNQSGSDVKRLFIYPPGKGGIAINTEDFMCLERDQFLNDVIIDFYLKYFLHQLPAEQQAKVHVFSTFFYNRLTTKTAKPTRRAGSEPEITLSPAQKRHLRVKNWTKNVDLFSNDFIIVPINENAHWFLAIICFPGMQGAKTVDGKATSATHHKHSKKATTPTSATKIELPPVEHDSDKDEAEGDESEFEMEDGEDASVTAKVEVDVTAIRQPCILIFDSLGGTSRARVVATLRDYLSCEYSAKKSHIRIFTKDNIRGSVPKVPQQNNYTDCGLYVLQYVESFFRKPIGDYRMPIRGLKDWFEEIEVTRKREDITKLIRELMLSYDRDVSILPTISLPTENGVVIEAPPDEEMEVEEEGSARSVVDSNVSDSVQGESQPDDNETASVVSSSTPLQNRESAMSFMRAKRIVKQKSESGEELNKKMKLDAD